MSPVKSLAIFDENSVVRSSGRSALGFSAPHPSCQSRWSTEDVNGVEVSIPVPIFRALVHIQHSARLPSPLMLGGSWRIGASAFVNRSLLEFVCGSGKQCGSGLCFHSFFQTQRTEFRLSFPFRSGSSYRSDTSFCQQASRRELSRHH